MALQEVIKWLRCNGCFRDMGKHQFFLTSCSHVFCNVCLDRAKTKKECPQCQNNDFRFMSISEALKAEQIKYLFQSVEEPFEKMQHALLFQTAQLLLNSKQLHNVDKKCRNYKEHCHRFLKENKKIKEQNAKLLSKINELTSEIQELKGRKPEAVTYMITPSCSHSSATSQNCCERARINSSRFQPHLIGPQNLEQPFLSSNAPIKVSTELDPEFRVPISSKIHRSLGSSTRSSSNRSLRTNPFSNYTPSSRYN